MRCCVRSRRGAPGRCSRSNWSSLRLLSCALISWQETVDPALGLGAGLAVGRTAVVLREKTDRRARTVSQAEASTGRSSVTTVGDGKDGQDRSSAGPDRASALRTRTRRQPSPSVGSASGWLTP